MKGVPLYAIGFWNLLSDYLSHDAINKLRDLGTFYHLLPENPNAAEWLIWWFLGFSISEQLQGIFGGMECIIDTLLDKLTNVSLNLNCRVISIGTTSTNKLRLDFAPGHGLAPAITSDEYHRVILALPKRALERIARQSVEAFSHEPEISGLLEAAFGFPMVKMFVAVKNRWWEEDNRANQFATRVPTRELHYWKGMTANSKQGLIMAYTDRPASSFWANYVPPGLQTDVARWPDRPLPPLLQRRLTSKIIQYINENEAPHVTSNDIVWYGIRDWGREPYCGANHAWRPERKYWVVMRRLAEIAPPSSHARRIHVCGEAYSDYHGFMEGSLRSAAYVLHRILDRNEDGLFKGLTWLPENGPGADETKINVDPNYLDELRNWMAHLDAVDPGEQYLYEE